MFIPCAHAALFIVLFTKRTSLFVRLAKSNRFIMFHCISGLKRAQVWAQKEGEREEMLLKLTEEREEGEPQVV